MLPISLSFVKAATTDNSILVLHDIAIYGQYQIGDCNFDKNLISIGINLYSHIGSYTSSYHVCVQYCIIS